MELNTKYDTYIRWIEYSLLIDVQQMTPSHHACTLIAKWLEPLTNEWTKVTLKKLVDGLLLLDFDQVNYFMHRIIQ